MLGSGEAANGSSVFAGTKPGLLARFRRSERGATALEFAAVAGPLVFGLLAALEIAMVFWNTQVLETATSTASRQIYTGEFQLDTANANQTPTQLAAAFKGKLCAKVTALFDCMSQVSVDVRDASTFTGANPPNPVTNKAYDTSGFSYKSVGAKSIGVVTASMEYKSFFPALSGSTLSNGNRVLIATSVFRTEPYSN